MFRMSHIVRRSHRGFGSAMAMALALAGGVTATSLVPVAAHAQDEEEPQNSEGFVKAYQPVAETFNEGNGDAAAASSQLPSVFDAVENDRDRLVAGNLALQIANVTSDPAMQRQGLEMMLESGQVPAEQVGQFNFFVGSLAMQAEDYAAAQTALKAAVDAGFTQDNAEGLLAESYFQAGQTEPGLSALKSAIDQRMAAGEPVDNQWLLRGLKMAYDSQDAAAATEWSTLLVDANPSEENWMNAIQVVGAVNSFDPQVQLDLLRLMSETGTLKERRDFAAYIEAADPRIMATEVDRVLNTGTQAGVFTTDDEYYQEVKRIVDERKSQDQSAADELAASAQTDAQSAKNAGDVYLSLADYATAEQMFQLAADNGSDRDLALTRLGIAQAKQGKMAEAATTFEQVSGEREPVAHLWAAYVENQSNGGSAPAPAAAAPAEPAPATAQ